MIKNIILILSILIIAITYIKIIMTYLKNRTKKIENITSFDLAKEITSNYDEINIVESKEINLSKYNLSRKVIRLTPKNYDKKDYFSLAISSQLSGYSLASINKDKNLNLISYLFKNIDPIPKTPIVTVLISLFTNTITDAKIGIILLGIILGYQYLLIQINAVSYQYSKEMQEKIISKKKLLEINKIQKTLLSTHTISFIITLILILREIIIILEI